MRLALFIVVTFLCATAFAAPQQDRQSEEEDQEDVQTESPVAKPVETRKPVESPKPAESSNPTSFDDESGSDVRREEHKKIVPFQFHRVCRELDLKRPNCSCVWESTFQDGLEQASERTRECKKDSEDEIHECLKGFAGYEECLANPSFEHHRPSGIPDDALSRKCQEFNLSDVMCTCLKDRDSNDALKAAIHSCKDEAKKAEDSKKSKRAAKDEVQPVEKSEHSLVRATPAPVAQQQVNKECVIAALNAHCAKPSEN